jgi:hypothetical protein
MAPHDEVLAAVPDGLQARVLAEPGRQYAVYVSLADAGRSSQSAGRGQPIVESALPLREAALALTLPAGEYEAQWISPITGDILKREDVKHTAGARTLVSPRFAADVALRVVARGP